MTSSGNILKAREKRKKENIRNIAIKYRLHPNKEQQILFAKTFGCCRKVWNLMLEAKKEDYLQFKKTGKSEKIWPARFKKEYPFLKEVDSLALANVGLNLLQAFHTCYDLHQTKKPKFHTKRKTRKAYKTNNQKGSVRIVNSYLRLPKVGLVKMVLHRKPEKDWKLKSATISQEKSGEYYAAVVFEYKVEDEEREKRKQAVDKTNALGLDYKSNGLYTDSEGNTARMPKFYRQAQKKLKRQQRKLSKKIGAKKGEKKSKRYLKQQRRINKIHAHIANQRKDYLHKRSTAIAKQYDVVCVENLDMKAIGNKKFGNGKATQDNGYGMFLDMLEYKLKNREKYFVKVSKWYASSQICHQCGAKQKMPLPVRTYHCPHCGYIQDRDYNAALNIRDEGLRLLQEKTAS